MHQKIIKSHEEWQKELPPHVFQATRQKTGEAPHTGKHLHTQEKGLYHCSNCDLEIFSSEAKFDGETGWPSFYQPVKPESVMQEESHSYSMGQVEVNCNRCEAYLGHVCDDGPQPTGLRYCINSAALNFKPE